MASSAVMPASGGNSARLLAAHPTGATPTGATVNRSVLWEELYRHATPAQRSELLALARSQGLLYAHQLPNSNNGKKPGPLMEEQGRLQQLANLQAHPPERWRSVRPEALAPCDTALDPMQRQAVARALAATDVCLIAGLPGTGKSRVVAEIVTQAASQGLRALFLAPRFQAIDAVLGQVAGRDVLYTIRCLEAGEKLEALPGGIRALTHEERARVIREASSAASQSRDQAAQRCRQRLDQGPLWAELLRLAEQCEFLDRQGSELRQQQAGLTAAVAREAARLQEAPSLQEESPLAGPIWAESSRRQQARARIASDLERLEQARVAQTINLDGLRLKLEKARRLAEAKQMGRWWTLAWWCALFAGDVKSRRESLETESQSVQAELAATAGEIQVRERERQECDQQFQDFLSGLLPDEVCRRHHQLQEQVLALAGEKGLLVEKWRHAISPLEDELRPVSMAVAAVDESQRRWQDRAQGDEDHCQFTQEWSAYLQDSADALTARLPALANLVAGTFSALASDKHFGEASGLVFDLLILEEAHQLSEADFFKLARRARRWILVGEPIWHCSPPSPPGKPCPPAPASFFQRLWLHFHCDPARLSYAWAAEGDRVCCRLRPFSAGHKHRLESERLADFPDIELRILSLPSAPPTLAEVVFPGSLSFAQAKQFIFKELQELAVETHGRGGYLIDEPKCWLFQLADATGRPTLEIELEPGLRELVAGTNADSPPVVPWQTSRLEFDKSAGWDWERVERWLLEHLQLRDLGRTILLEVAHRMRPPLALLLSDMLFGGRQAVGDFRAPLANGQDTAAGNGQAMVFVPVPALRRKDKAGPAAKPPSGLLPREGAGLELELGNGRNHERVPAELKGLMPTRGLVNPCEAQALVRRLEGMLADPGQLAAVAHPHSPAVAVIALFPAQVELLRRLVQRSPRLRQSAVPVEVGLPGLFCHREFPIVLVSLTRSNPRAVAFAEQTLHVVQALTRARSQVILFGDPGTLARRSQWQGRVDHLDDNAARQEEILIKDLVRYLQGKGKHAWAFHLCEGHP